MITILAFFLVSFFLPAIAKKAGKFSLPLAKHESAVPELIPLQFAVQKRHGRTQKSLDRDPTPDTIFTYQDSRSRGNPIDAPYLPVPFYKYITDLSVGTPPQSFRVVVDLDWADLILPSSTCVSAVPRFCNPSNNTYNSSASSTYIDKFNGTFDFIRYGPVIANTRLSEDVLTFADQIQVPSQLFKEIAYYSNWYGGDWRDPFPDGVLGLAIGKEYIPGEFGTPTSLPSPFRNMVDQKVLDKNMFSIVFPSDDREEGSLTFGGYDEDLLDGNLVSHPIYPQNTTAWQFEIQSVSMKATYDIDPGTLLMYENISGTWAWAMSARPTIGFQGSIVNEMFRHINWWNDGCFRPYTRVRCGELSLLPEIIIGLQGQNITLRGQDYVSKIALPDPEDGICSDPYGDVDRCYVMIDWLGPPAGQRVAILGTPFLERVMGVWDWDARTVSFGNLKK